MSKWDWLKALPSWSWHDLSIQGWPGWELDGGRPLMVWLAIVKGKGPSSRELAVAFDDIAEGPFYYRDWTDSGLPFVDDGETYRSAFYFARRADKDRFEALLGRRNEA